ncbi:MAG: hypothetical protein HY918_03205, partial [Candidatus Doudnabacteria bacterium]|nr:hypothetical protein [Candidatus Doudnabacteria bacterium]
SYIILQTINPNLLKLEMKTLKTAGGRQCVVGAQITTLCSCAGEVKTSGYCCLVNGKELYQDGPCGVEEVPEGALKPGSPEAQKAFTKKGKGAECYKLYEKEMCESGQCNVTGTLYNGDEIGVCEGIIDIKQEENVVVCSGLAEDMCQKTEGCQWDPSNGVCLNIITI